MHQPREGISVLGQSSCFLPPRITSCPVHAVSRVFSLAACCSWARKRWPGWEVQAAQACVCVSVRDHSWVSAPNHPAKCWKPWKLLVGVFRCLWAQPLVQQECLQHPKRTAPYIEEEAGWGSSCLCPLVPRAAMWVLQSHWHGNRMAEGQTGAGAGIIPLRKSNNP